MVRFIDWIKQDNNIRIALVIGLTFYWVAVSELIAGIYFGFLVAEYIIERERFSNFRTFIGGPNDWSKTIATVLSGYAVYLGMSAAIIGATSFNSVISFLSQNTTPILAKDPTLLFISLVFVGPFIENRFFWRITEWLANGLGVPLDYKDKRMFFITLLIAGMFAAWHITAKLASDQALFVTFGFWIIISYVTMYRRQMIDGKLIHVIGNAVVRIFLRG